MSVKRWSHKKDRLKRIDEFIGRYGFIIVTGGMLILMGLLLALR
jgi:hypothetical protein